VRRWARVLALGDAFTGVLCDLPSRLVGMLEKMRHLKKGGEMSGEEIGNERARATGTDDGDDHPRELRECSGADEPKPAVEDCRPRRRHRGSREGETGETVTSVHAISPREAMGGAGALISTSERVNGWMRRIAD
jgi:hypothetical protein